MGKKIPLTMEEKIEREKLWMLKVKLFIKHGAPEKEEPAGADEETGEV